MGNYVLSEGSEGEFRSEMLLLVRRIAEALEEPRQTTGSGEGAISLSKENKALYEQVQRLTAKLEATRDVVRAQEIQIGPLREDAKLGRLLKRMRPYAVLQPTPKSCAPYWARATGADGLVRSRNGELREMLEFIAKRDDEEGEL